MERYNWEIPLSLLKDTENFKDVETRPDIEILIATMDRENLDFLELMFPNPLPEKVAVLIVNQTEDKILVSKNPKIRVIHAKGRGLSKSRNMALENATADICVFTDDDVIFLKNFDKKIRQAFAHFPKSSALRLRYENRPGEWTKTYSKEPIKNLSWLDILNTSSIEIAVKRRDILENNILFDENFGLNSVFKMGEEQVFLAELRRKDLQLSYYPVTINRHESLTSTDRFELEERYYIQGAFTKAVFAQKALLWLSMKIGFDLKHGKLRFGDIWKALKAAKKGKKAYLKLRYE